MDTNEIAIADVLRHPKLGLISYQPDLTEPISDLIRVRDKKGNIHRVLVSQCDWAEIDERNYYWEHFPVVSPEEKEILIYAI